MAFQLSSKTQSIHKTVSFPAALHLRAPRQQHLLQKHQEIRSAGVQGINMAGSVRASAQASDSSNSHAGHAFLHDFCMTIPYGGIAAVSGLLAFAFKAPAVGLQLAAVAAVVIICSVLSLKAWKAGGSSTPYTLVSAGASGWVAYQMWLRVAASWAPVPSGILLAVSAALSAFCLYNILAGGNPPPAKKSA